jgi:hypothetical protein
MANVNMHAGLKMVGDRASGVAGAAAAIAGMSVDDRTAGFAATDTACNTGGAPANFLGNPLDSTPTSPAAASPHVVTHVMTLSTSQFNGNTVKRVALHNTNAPVVGGTTLMFGIDGTSLTKAATFSLTITFKLSYS